MAKGAFLKLFQTFLYSIAFCCAAIILGIYSYFLATLADRDLPISETTKAVEGLSGAAVLYTVFAVLLTCFLGGMAIFAFLAIILNLLFCGAFIAIAVLTRDGAHSCSGFVRTPLGNGQSNAKQGFSDSDGERQYTYAASLGTACRLNTACFAVAIAGVVLFLIAAIVQVLLHRHHKKEKAFGPSPANNYTRGSGNKWFARRSSGRKWFGRRSRKNNTVRDPEVAGGAGLTAPAHDMRPSHDTAYTGSTAAGNASYDHGHKPVTGGFHTAPSTNY